MAGHGGERNLAHLGATAQHPTCEACVVGVRFEGEDAIGNAGEGVGEEPNICTDVHSNPAVRHQVRARIAASASPEQSCLAARQHSAHSRESGIQVYSPRREPASDESGGCSRSSTKVMVNGWPARVLPSASVNGKEAHRLSICATAMRYDERCVSDASLD